jgi:hypothetical protein
MRAILLLLVRLSITPRVCCCMPLHSWQTQWGAGGSCPGCIGATSTSSSSVTAACKVHAFGGCCSRLWCRRRRRCWAARRQPLPAAAAAGAGVAVTWLLLLLLLWLWCLFSCGPSLAAHVCHVLLLLLLHARCTRLLHWRCASVTTLLAERQRSQWWCERR